ncbi:hypothetical protein HYALB_00009317 [Hymenoscyphus albidus]|uniref:Extracellular membrane protein CFEM domain-containing protein n=1 Tax=Hymenoscyphus albidus TaxID=595503 RepID=A0A9N9LQT1_9HELO|nr:hypothetical protein HYALB_00009317 [Hymenoscyphus albidus]
MKSFTALFILAIATLSIAAPSPIPQNKVPAEYQVQCDASCDRLCRQFSKVRANCNPQTDEIDCLCDVIGQIRTSFFFRNEAGNVVDFKNQ